MMKKPILRDAQIHFSPIDHESRLGKDLVQIDTKSEDFVSKCASAWNRLLPKQYRSTHAFRCFSTCTCHHYWICHKNSFFRVPIKPIHKITSVECGFMGHIRTNSFKLFYDVELMPQLKTTKGDSFLFKTEENFFNDRLLTYLNLENLLVIHEALTHPCAPIKQTAVSFA